MVAAQGRGTGVEVDIPGREDVRIIQTSAIGIIFLRLAVNVLDASSERSVDREVPELLLIGQDNISIDIEVMRMTGNQTSVRACDRCVCPRVHVHLVLVRDHVGISACLERKMVVDFVVDAEIGDGPVAFPVVWQHVYEPIRVLVEAARGGVPILGVEVALRVEYLVVLSVVVKRLSALDSSAREHVESDKRVEVEAARGRTVLHILEHQVYVCVKGDVIVEQIGRLPEVEIMLVEQVLSYDSLAEGVGVGKIGLGLVVSGTYRKRVCRRDTGFEEFLHVAVVPAAVFVAPAGGDPGVGVLKVRNSISRFIEGSA